MKSTRPYTMTNRARSVEETRRRILDSCFALSATVPLRQISLDAVADGAGVSVQTVLRQFGSRDHLIAATGDHARALVAQERQPPAPDVPSAIRTLIGHYELRGDMVLMMLGQESTDDDVKAITDSGRRLHRQWVADVFADRLEPLSGDCRASMLDLLVVATDVYAWKLLRRDRRLSRARTEDRMLRLVAAVLANGPAHGAEEASPDE